MSISYWEKESFLHYDYAIIGSGITGTSLAIELAEAYPKANIVVLERGILPAGASTRNAGFACIGSLSEKAYDKQLMGTTAFFQLIEERVQGLQILRNRLGDDRIEYQKHGGYELLMTPEQEACLNHLEEINNTLEPLLGKDTFSLAKHKISSFGFDPTIVKQLIVNKHEGQLHTGKMMKALQQIACSKGVTFLSGYEVSGIEEEEKQVKIIHANTPISAKQIFLCTNAFTKKFLPNEDITPGRGQVLVTKPLSNIAIQGIFSFDEGYYYFRNHQNRIVFGGGRNLDFETETTQTFGSNSKIIQQLSYYLKEVICPGQAVEIDYTWSGIMAFGGNKTPLVKQVSPRVFVGARLNGMGVAIGSKVAQKLLTLQQHS